MTDPRLTEIVEGHEAFLRVILSFVEIDHPSSRFAFYLFQAPERSQSRRHDVGLARGDCRPFEFQPGCQDPDFPCPLDGCRPRLQVVLVRIECGGMVLALPCEQVGKSSVCRWSTSIVETKVAKDDRTR
jgi:hypothetical protein